jgi:hypothetical protein
MPYWLDVVVTLPGKFPGAVWGAVLAAVIAFVATALLRVPLGAGQEAHESDGETPPAASEGPPRICHLTHRQHTDARVA